MRVQRKRAERRKAVPITHTVPVKNDTPMVASNHTKPKAKGSTDHNTKALAKGSTDHNTKALAKGSTDHNTKALAKVSSDKGHGQIATDRPPKSTVKDSLVCLTNEQLQQILSTINNSTISSQDQDVHSHAIGSLLNKPDDEIEDVPLPWVICGQPSGLFSSLGEREMDKEALEAKRTQWRKELEKREKCYKLICILMREINVSCS
uniref:Coiled-coil domain containing 66 n=1 Tax=Hucho hucho TaxID=62062 RepID=A0A4W5PXN8_9TELE